MDEAQWHSHTSVLRCELIQPIPAFGRAVFAFDAGRGLRFYLQSPASPLDAGQAALSTQAPRWNPDLPAADLGLVNVVAGAQPVSLDAALATRLLTELYKGMSPRFLRRAWYDEEEAVAVALSSVSFRRAYTAYQRCLAELSPVGLAELERSRINFASDESKLNSKAQQWLDTLGNYLLRASDVDRVFIDGHTDDTHTSSYNVELSRKRAEAVADYLVGLGVSRNQLTVRYHGERFPVKPNSSAAGKAFNRRVTLRVQRLAATLAQR
ncbi:MAG: OmpA family protein [Gammaproteobacteria bacterium]|nr:OmpA family protein [Gammaproteobacteria bacterium]